MSRKKKSTQEPKPVAGTQNRQPAKKPAPGNSSTLFSAPFLFALLLLVTEWIPEGDAGDTMFNQWLYLGLVSFATSLYLFFNETARQPFTQVIKRPFTYAYAGLLALSLLSISWSFNKVEGLFTLPLFVVPFILVMNFAVLLYGNKDLFRPVAVAVSIALLLQTFYVTGTFFKNISLLYVDKIAMETVLYAGNKNILAASMMMKLPFLFYLMYSSRSLYMKLFASLVFTLLAFSVVVTTSRESLLNIIVQSLVFLAFIVITLVRQGKKKQLSQMLALVMVPLLIGYFSSSAAIEEAKRQVPYSNILAADALSRLSTIELSREGSSFRIDQWLNASGYIAKHPLTGAGLGNWKIHTLPGEKYSSNFISSKYAHNDFLQVGAEMGVPGLLLFLFLFVALALGAWKLLRTHGAEEVNIIAFFLGLGLLSYTIDVMFAFPQERPVIQIYFVLFSAFILALHHFHFPLDALPGKMQKGLPILFLAIMLPMLWLQNRQRESAAVQMSYLNDFVLEKPQSQWRPEDDPFPAIPNLAMTTVPVDLMKSRYMIDAGNFPEAKRLLRKAALFNPNTPILNFMWALTYVREKKPDSAVYYSLRSIEYRPKINNNFQMLQDAWNLTNDTGLINRSFMQARAMVKDDGLESRYIHRVMAIPEMQASIPDIMNRASRDFPQSLYVNQDLASWQFNKGNYDSAFYFCARAVKKFRSDQVFQNMGLIRFTQQRWEEAIPFLDSAISIPKLKPSGIPEVIKARCLINLNRTAEICPLLQSASGYGNQEAGQLYKQYCLGR